LAKRLWIQGTRQAVNGYGVVDTERHPVAVATTVLGPVT
jgi:hypothetical protein